MTRRVRLAVVTDPRPDVSDPPMPLTDKPGPSTPPADLPLPELVDRLYARHRDLVYRVGLRMSGGNRAFAEDITQDVFVRVFRHARRVIAMESPEGWFYRTATNRCLNRLRKERFLDLPPVRWVLGDRVRRPVDPETLGMTEDLLRHALAEIMKMPPKARACFFMVHVDGKSQVEIGELLGHSKGYVSKLIARCERAVIELIDREETP
jgi:RNA polymerase sigma-70 factor, ECF subfamily